MLASAHPHDHGTSDRGAVYVYQQQSGQWLESVELLPTDTDGADGYGAGIALSANRIAIGAPGDEEAGLTAGAAYVYERTETGWTTGVKLFASDASNYASFGTSVAMQGERLIVGAGCEGGSCAGAAYVFEIESGAWIEKAKIRADDLTGGEWFGNCAAISGDRIVIGAPNYAGCVFGAGAAYVFQLSGTTWVQKAKLCASDAASADTFGFAVAISGRRILVGSPYHYEGSIRTGAVYVFEELSGTWTETARLLPPDSTNQAWNFGHGVALEGDLAVIGAITADGMGFRTGAAYVFECVPSGWVAAEKLQAFDGATDDRFGTSVRVASNRALVSAILADHSGYVDVGAAYGFEIGVGSSYCDVEPNSTGAPALISSVGSPSVASNELVLAATPVPQQTGLFFLGPTQVQLSFGNGWRCVGGALLRLPPHLPQAGILRQVLDLGAPPLAGNVVAGSRWHFQAWYRDPMAGGAFFNTSNALSILFEP